MINGWKDQGSSNLEKSNPLYREQKEFDFLIVSQPSQTVIHIEVKKKYCKNQFDSASKQLQNGLQMFQENIPFPGKVKWKYIKVIYFGFDENEQPFENKCLKCKNFIIGSKTDLNFWWNDLTKSCLPQETTERFLIQPDDIYLNILRFLLHQMYKQQDCATTEQLIKETHQTSDKICNPDTIMFWSKDQYKTLKDFKDKKVALTSGFGTGKTILIKAKAEELIKSGQNVVIVIYETIPEKTILRTEYEQKFCHKKTSTKITSLSGTKGKL